MVPKSVTFNDLDRHGYHFELFHGIR